MTPNQCWELWIRAIAKDEDNGMDLDRLIRHIHKHFNLEMPNAEANQLRWLQWLAGSYNLLAILSVMVGYQPSFEIGVARLFNKWQRNPFDHTPPPVGMMDIYRDLNDKGRSQYKHFNRETQQ